VPSAKVEVVVAPLVPQQELITEGSSGVIYWEGAVEGKGQSAGKEIACEGYVELTGYAGSLGGLF
jgi:predicted secreted hydrolase